jgi:hypothetical protein
MTLARPELLPIICQSFIATQSVTMLDFPQALGKKSATKARAKPSCCLGKLGTLIDNTVSLSGSTNFFLVFETVTQGTVSPTFFNVIEDTTRLSIEIHQRLAYAITHLYYNWPVR